MVSVEKLLEGLVQLSLNRQPDQLWNTWNVNFVSNVSEFISRGSAISMNQGGIILKIAARCPIELSSKLRIPVQDIKAAIASPTYDKPPYQSASVKREVRYAGNNVLAFRFKMDSVVVQDIKELRGCRYTDDPVYQWDPRNKIWKVLVEASNLERVKSLIFKHKFGFDDTVHTFLQLCAASVGAQSSILIDDDDINHVYANVCNNPLLALILTSTMKGVKI